MRTLLESIEELEPVEAWEVEEVVKFYRISYKDALWMLALIPKIERQKNLLILEDLKKLTHDDNDQQFQDLKALLRKNHLPIFEPVKLPFSVAYTHEQIIKRKQLTKAWDEYLSKPEPFRNKRDWKQFLKELKTRGLVE